jgi:hypothetical protein
MQYPAKVVIPTEAQRSGGTRIFSTVHKNGCQISVRHFGKLKKWAADPGNHPFNAKGSKPDPYLATDLPDLTLIPEH